jgi:hypothetical protein
MENLFKRFTPVIRSLSAAELDGAPSLNTKLLLARYGALQVCYAPFEFVNPKAKLVIVGITPGYTQMLNALREARRQLDAEADEMTVLKAAKRAGGFSGSLRPALVALLDSIGINRWLRIGSCSEFFGDGAAAPMVQTASALRYPVFLGGKNYNGTPNMARHPLLKEQLLGYFGEDARLLRVVFVPLGDKASEALHFLAGHGCLDRSCILDGLPHPSGTNGERIAYFLGRKARGTLSAKTDPDKLDQARERLTKQVLAFA